MALVTPEEEHQRVVDVTYALVQELNPGALVEDFLVVASVMQPSGQSQVAYWAPATQRMTGTLGLVEFAKMRMMALTIFDDDEEGEE